jgi:cytochrome c peroxidase
MAMLILLLFVTACKHEHPPVEEPEHLSAPIRPDHFPPAHYNFETHTYSKKGFELGRKLFFDPVLSVDESISCGSCHHQKDAFADGGKALSVGVFGQTTDRNSPPIMNMAWNTSFMWDGGINHIEVQPFAPLINPKEMGEDLNHVLTKLLDHPEYPALFEQAFGKTPLDDQQFFWALAQYMGNLVSSDSKYDQYLLGEVPFTETEQQGYNLFRAHCEACHQEPLLTDYGFHNNGLDTLFLDVGRFAISQQADDMGTFKTPSLRNIMLTAPYMHDGRFEHILDVIDHYSHGIKNSPTLSPALHGHIGGIGMSDAEKQALLSFLETLTDYEFISDPELAE